MKDGKSLGMSIFCVVLSILLIALIIFAVGVNYIFGSSMNSGEIFGMNIFVMNSDIMEPEITNGSAVLADSDEKSVLVEGNVILFKEDDETENVMRIKERLYDDDNKDTVYKVVGDNDPDRELDIPKENVVAKCVIESKRLGSVITFMKSMAGIVVCMIIPCVILLTLLFLKIRQVRRRELAEDDDIVYPETYGIGIGSGKDERDPSKNPLFDPAKAYKFDEGFAMKKNSIAENFSVKQGAKMSYKPSEPEERDEQEESAVERFKAAVDEKPSAPISRKATLAPDIKTIDKSEKLEAIKAVLSDEEEPEPDNTDNSYEHAREYQSANRYDDRRTDNESTPSRRNHESSVNNEPPVRKEDNIKSIDDLIKALEEEKKKL